MAALEATRKRKAKGTEVVSFALLQPLLYDDVEKWPAAILCGQNYLVDMDTADSQMIHNLFGRTARRWQLGFTVRIIGASVLFQFRGKPMRRVA